MEDKSKNDIKILKAAYNEEHKKNLQLSEDLTAFAEKLRRMEELGNEIVLIFL